MIPSFCKNAFCNNAVVMSFHYAFRTRWLTVFIQNMAAIYLYVQSYYIAIHTGKQWTKEK